MPAPPCAIRRHQKTVFFNSLPGDRLISSSNFRATPSVRSSIRPRRCYRSRAYGTIASAAREPAAKNNESTFTYRTVRHLSTDSWRRGASNRLYGSTRTHHVKPSATTFENAADSIVQELLLADAGRRAQIRENLCSLLWLTNKLLEEGGDDDLASARARAMHPIP